MLKVIADEVALHRRRAQMRSGGRGRSGVLSVALGDEVAAHIAAHASERDKSERRLVARHRHARPWQGSHRGGRGGSGPGAAGEPRAGRSGRRRAPRVRRVLGRLAARLHAAGRARPAAGRARPSTGSTLRPIPSNPYSARSGLEPGSGHGRLGRPNSRREFMAGGRTRPSSRAAREQSGHAVHS